MTIKTTTSPRLAGTSFHHSLNELLIDEYLLYTETRICHWHLEEQPTVELRNLLQRQFETLDTFIDRMAAYLRAHEHTPVLRPRAFQHIRIFLADDTVPTSVMMLRNLKHAHTTQLQRLQRIHRHGSTPAGAAMLVEELISQHEQMLGLLKAHLTLGILQAYLSEGHIAAVATISDTSSTFLL